ncbi:MAG: ribose-phosphate diphosphokinase [bacterium]
MSHTRPLLLGFPESYPQAQAVAEKAALDFAQVMLHRFPDSETRVQLPEKLPEHVLLYRSLDHPNDKLVELILAAQGARSAGVKKLTLIAPYLCYMRQDKAFHPGEVVSQRVIGELLSHYVDGLLTVDSHLHRIHHLGEAVPVEQAINVTATEPMAQFLSQQVENPFLLGPDGESEQWVANIATHHALDHALDYVVATKQRLGDRRVDIKLPEANFTGRNVVLVDDVASTGKTLLAAAKLLRPYQPASTFVLVTHALFVDDAMQGLRDAGVENIWSCDAISHSTNAVSLATLLADELKAHFLP